MKNKLSITITKYEQNALLIRTPNTQLAIDFGSLSPKLPTINGSVAGAIVSHVHGDLNIDHLRSIKAPVWAATEVVERLREANISATLLEAGKTFCIGDFKLTPVVVDHGNISAPIANLGFLIQTTAVTIFFCGDMAVPLAFPNGTINLLLIPVGGGKVFSAEEAARYVTDNNYHGLVVPMHYHGQADPASAVKFQKLVGVVARVELLDVGERMEVTP